MSCRPVTFQFCTANTSPTLQHCFLGRILCLPAFCLRAIRCWRTSDVLCLGPAAPSNALHDRAAAGLPDDQGDPLADELCPAHPSPIPRHTPIYMSITKGYNVHAGRRPLDHGGMAWVLRLHRIVVVMMICMQQPPNHQATTRLCSCAPQACTTSCVHGHGHSPHAKQLNKHQNHAGLPSLQQRCM